MTRFFSGLLVLLLLGGFLAVVVQVLRARAEAGKGLPAYSMYAKDRNGLAPAAQLLHQLGWEPVAVTRPIQHTRYRGLLLLVEPEGTALLPGQAPDLGATDVQALLRWVERGNTLLLCGRRLNALHRALDVVVTQGARAAEEELVAVALSEAGGYTDGIDRLVVEGRAVVEAEAGLPLWWVGDSPGAVVLRRGRGRVLVVADPSLLTLRGLRREDNVLFLVNVAALHGQDRQVYFDEYHHGLRSGGGFWGYLRYHDQHGLLLPVLLVAVVAGWSVAKRLGPAVPTPRESHADAVDYASAVARIYQRAGVRQRPAQTLARDFLGALARHLHLRPSARPAEMLAAWRRRHPGDAGRSLEGLLRIVSELRQGAGVSEQRLLTAARALDRFKNEVLRAG
jgi:hypothetical protein